MDDPERAIREHGEAMRILMEAEQNLSDMMWGATALGMRGMAERLSEIHAAVSDAGRQANGALGLYCNAMAHGDRKARPYPEEPR